MCTVVISFLPGAAVPVLLVGVRDELFERPWEPPGRHWAAHPEVIGGRDLQAGGTWLVVDPAARRAAVLLNGRGVAAPETIRRSRGELPLVAVADGGLPEMDLRSYDPFHLVLAEPAGVRSWSWDGGRTTTAELPPGTHMIVNNGWERGENNRRVAYFRPRFARTRPGIGRAVPGDGGDAGRAENPPGDRPWDGDPRVFWGEWPVLASGAGLATDDPRALVVRFELPDGRVWGSGSVTLLGLAEEGVRYDFSARPADPGAFHRVLP